MRSEANPPDTKILPLVSERAEFCLTENDAPVGLAPVCAWAEQLPMAPLLAPIKSSTETARLFLLLVTLAVTWAAAIIAVYRYGIY